MNRSFGLGVLGFVIGGGIVCVLEFRPDFLQTLMADEVAEKNDAVLKGDDQPPPEISVEESEALPARTTSVSGEKNDEDALSADPQRSQRQSARRSDRPARSDREPEGRPAPRRPASRAVNRDPDTQRDFEVRIRRILVGADVVKAAVIDEPELRKHERSGRYVVYFDLSVTNRAKRGAPRISHEDFRLEDGKGMIYSPLKPRSPLSGRLGPAETARGGVAFAVYNDSAPARLLIRTGAETFQSLPESIFTPGGS